MEGEMSFGVHKKGSCEKIILLLNDFISDEMCPQKILTHGIRVVFSIYCCLI